MISESELRHIAHEVGVRPTAMDQALGELQGELRPSPSPLPSPLRRWSPFAFVIAVCVVGALAAPAHLAEIAVPMLIASVLTLFAALAPMWARRYRQSTKIGIDGVRYATFSGDRFLPWTSVVELKVELPGTIHIVTPTASVMLVLKDFGHPDAVLAAIKSRIAQASVGLRSTGAS